jgi:hypothetical protein
MLKKNKDNWKHRIKERLLNICLWFIEKIDENRTRDY